MRPRDASLMKHPRVQPAAIGALHRASKKGEEGRWQDRPHVVAVVYKQAGEGVCRLPFPWMQKKKTNPPQGGFGSPWGCSSFEGGEEEEEAAPESQPASHSTSIGACIPATLHPLPTQLTGSPIPTAETHAGKQRQVSLGSPHVLRMQSPQVLWPTCRHTRGKAQCAQRG